MVQPLAQPKDLPVALRGCPHDHLGALPGRGKGRGTAVQLHLLPALGGADRNLPHGGENGAAPLVRTEQVQAALAGQLDVDAHSIRQKAQLLHQFRRGPGDGLGMDVPAEMVLFAQNAQRFHHALGGVIRAALNRAGEEQPLNVIALVKLKRQVRQFPRGKAGPRHIVGAPVDAIAAVVGAHIAEQHLQQAHAPAVRGKGVADARGRAAAHAAVPARPVQPAGGAGNVILGAVG